MLILTESGTVYEVDVPMSQLRKLSSAYSTSAYVGQGEWKAFEEITTPVVGQPLSIIWADERATVTSRVVSFE